ETVRGKAVNGKRLLVKRFKHVEDARDSHILFVGASEADRLSEILKILDGSPILAVSEIDGFASRGGGIAFRMEGNKVRFDINVAAVERSHLKISAQLMKLGRIVAEPGHGGG